MFHPRMTNPHTLGRCCFDRQARRVLLVSLVSGPNPGLASTDRVGRHGGGYWPITSWASRPSRPRTWLTSFPEARSRRLQEALPA